MNSKGSYSFEEIPSVETLQGKYTRTSYVCHHSACQDKNKHRPFMLCRSCDKSLHSDPQYTGHLRLDLPKGSSLAHSPLTRSLPSQVNCDFSDGEAEDDFAAPVKHDDKNIKFSSNSSPKLESKFRRKKACKRHHAESQRSKSLTQIDYLQAETMKRDTLDSRSEPDMVELGHEKCLIFEDSKDKDDKESSPVERKQSPKFMIKSPSKANSAEEFTVCFDMFEGTVTESVPATRGVNLKDAMSGIIEKHGLDVDSINIFLEASNTPLSWQFDSFPFGGNILHVKAKDNEDCPFTRSAYHSTSSQGKSKAQSKEKKLSGEKKPKRTYNFYIEDTSINNMEMAPQNIIGSVEGSWKTSRPKAGSRLSGLFANPFRSSESMKSVSCPADYGRTFLIQDKDKMEALTDLLNRYTQQGLPELPDLLSFYKRKNDDSLYELEDHWSQIISNSSELTKRQKDQQEAIWELLQTEVRYIKKIRVIIDLFLSCLINLQNECILNEIETERLFSNINEVYYANCLFWKDHLLQVLSEARQNRLLFNPMLMYEGFIKFDQIFLPYTKYCLDQADCLQYMKVKYKDNELLKAYITWGENQKECNRLTLNDLLVKPMQRLTKYSLLLKAIHKKTDSEDQKSCLVEMIENVDKYVTHVNATLRKRYEKERLSVIINRIENYDVVDATNDELEKALRDYSSLDLTCPMPGCGSHQNRQLLLEGSLKLRDAYSKMDVHCFLFTDMLLVCKQTNKKGDKFKIVRPPFVVDKLIVQEMKDSMNFLLIYLNEYNVAVSAYTLHTGVPAQTRIWIEHIKKAQELYKEAKNTASEKPDGTLRYLGIDDDDVDLDFPSSALLISKSPRCASRENIAHVRGGSMDSNDYTSRKYDAFGRGLSVDMIDSLGDTLTVGNGMRTRAYSVDSRVPVLQSSVQSTESENNYTLKVSLSTESYTSDNDQPSSQKNSPKSSPRSPQYPPPSPWLSRKGLPGSNGKPHFVRSKPVRTNSSSSLYDNVSPQSPLEKSFEFNEDLETFPNEIEDRGPRMEEVEDTRGKISQRRSSRTDKRYHTADSIENMKKQDKDHSIHKRLSWNFGTTAVDINIEDMRSKNKHIGKCLSSESMRSSSGVSSVGSLHRSPSGEIEGAIITVEDTNAPDSCRTIINEGDYDELHDPSQSDCHQLEVPDLRKKTFVGSDSKLNITATEMKDGISSVQITLPEGRRKPPTKADLIRMKKFLLTNSSVEASEV